MFENNKELSQFAKADKGKLEISLVPTQIIRDIAEVRMYGKEKYHAPNNWVIVDKKRYVDALMRHILAFLDDEDSVDEESGIPHYKHAACNLAFLCEMKNGNWENRQAYLIDADEDLKKKLKEMELIDEQVKKEVESV